MNFDFDVIVIGGGHAGCEAACAAANLGSRTLLLTADMNRIAQMSCNPAVGGIAKGQIVREIDALGGQMGIVADKTAIQFRMLNRSKGPAMWSPRVQSDRTAFTDCWRRILDATDGLSIFQDMATELILDRAGEMPCVVGVRTALGVFFKARSVVLTAGTFLNGLMHIGDVQMHGGRLAESASYGITEQLAGLGFRVDRMKTGTPVRIDGRSVDYSLVTPQYGDDVSVLDSEELSCIPDFHKFSYLPEVRRELRQRPCFILHTTPECHEVLRRNLDRSPLYNGTIHSIGPRYCPSIETKIVTFADKQSHQLFLEPEGECTQEFYLNGFSSSLPWEVQIESLQQIPALKNVQIYRPGYAIEYDFFDPTQLNHALHSKLVRGLFLAGQVNGTTGYEEAAGQGLIAGINAHRWLNDLPEFVLSRDKAYIGVLIDDLVTKGVDEPYRMFTSRAEYRILLRQDDADMRLTPLGYDIGLASRHRYDLMIEKRNFRDALIDLLRCHSLRAGEDVNEMLLSRGGSPIKGSTKLYDLLLRPQILLEDLLALSPAVREFVDEWPQERSAEILEATEILVKYSGYIERERMQADKMHRLEYVRIPDDVDYASMTSLSTEARQKLSRIRPASIGQASRIPGVSPADVNILLLLLNR